MAAAADSVDWARACLCVLCGLPAAGKSSLSRRVCLAARLRGWRTAVVHYDELIPDQVFHIRAAEGDVTSHEERTEWKLHRNAVLQCIEEFLEKQEMPLELPGNSGNAGSTWERCARDLLTPPLDTARADAAPFVFLLDDNFYYPSMRYEVFQLARKYSLGFCQVYVQCNLDLCISRNETRPYPIPTEVIAEMVKRLEPPNPRKNPWEAKSIMMETEDDMPGSDIQRVIELIASALSDPLSPVEDDVEQKEADRQRCAASVVHQADQACRRLISDTMKKARETGTSSQHMRSLATQLSESKAEFLQNLRGHCLQNVNFTQGEDVDVDHVVKTAIQRFEGEIREILLKLFQNHLHF